MPRLSSLTFILLSLFLHHTTSLSAQPIKRTDLKPGLVFTIRDDADATPITRLEPGVALNLAPGEAAHPLSAGGSEFTWTGYINILTPGKHTFDAYLLGSVQVTIGNISVLNSNEPKTVELPAGIQPFTVTLKRLPKQAGMRLELYWKGPEFEREPIPFLAVGHLPKQRPDRFEHDLARDHGRLLFEELSCIRCHSAEAGSDIAMSLVERTGPNLTEIGKRVNPGWLDAWLADPRQLRPHSTMPKMFTDDDLGTAERYAVVSYLRTLGGPMPAQSKLPNPRDLVRSINEGRKLFLTAGCANCHGDHVAGPPSKAKLPDDPDADLKPVLRPEDSLYSIGTAQLQGLYTLGHVGSKTTPDQLVKFLLNPLGTNPHGRMPNLNLSGDEATHLARYLGAVINREIESEMPKEPKLKPADVLPKAEREQLAKLKPEQQWQEAGKRLLTSKGCVNCHTVEPKGTKLPPLKATTLAKVRSAGASGCLAAKPDPATAPAYALDAEQRAALTAFLADGLTRATPSPIFQAKLAIRRFQCLNCHQRDGEGGISLTLLETMKGMVNATNAEDIPPPHLTSVGHKLRTSWMKRVLTNGDRARPWMALRMPQYGAENVGFLAEALPKLEGTIADDTIGKVAFDAAKIETGRTLVGKTGHGCIACHDISGVQTGGTRGPDLATTNLRVRYDWYKQWMHQPQRLAPGTRMPQYFPNGKALLTTILNGNAEAQIEAMWAYFSLGPGLPLPFGLEPPQGLIVTVGDRPEILRTFMPDNGGTKAIAVGFPRGSNIDFDAATCRLAYAWAGNFLDASPVWNNRGGAPAKLLGPKFWIGPEGFPWAVTESRTPPDLSKRGSDPAYGHPLPNDAFYSGPRLVQFNGYSLDENGFPTFQYELLDKKGASRLTVAEKAEPLPVTVATGLKRTLAATLAPNSTTWLHVGSTKEEPRAISPSGRTLKLDLKAAEAEVPALGLKLVLPGEGEKATVLAVGAAPVGTAWRFVPKQGGGWDVLLRLVETDRPVKAELQLYLWGLPRDEAELLKGLKMK